MAVNYKDLPMKAREQVAAKLLREQQARIAASAAPPRNDSGERIATAPAGPRNDGGRSKYGNKKATRVMADGRKIVFDSQKEARRYDELIFWLQAGVISELKLQPEFTLQEPYTTADGDRVRAIRYRADFSIAVLLWWRM